MPVPSPGGGGCFKTLMIPPVVATLLMVALKGRKAKRRPR